MIGRGPRRRTAIRGRYFLAALVPTVLCAVLSWWQPFGVRALRDLLFDSYQRLSPRDYDPETPVRVVAIDDEALKSVGQWPWPRARFAELIDALTRAGAAVIAVDVLFSEAERPGAGEEKGAGERALAAAIGRGRVVLGVALAEAGAVPKAKAGFAVAGGEGDDPRRLVRPFGGALMPLPELTEAAQGFGAMNILPDRDLIVREIPTIFNVTGELVPSLDVEALRVGQGASSVLLRLSSASGDTAFGRSGITAVKVGNFQALTGRDGSVRIRFAGTNRDRLVPVGEVLSGRLDPKRVEGQLVLVGVTASALFDLRATPLEADVPGVVIRAELIESLLSGAYLTRPDYMSGFETILVVLAGAFSLSAATRMPPLSAAIVTGVLVAGFLTASGVSFLYLHQLLDPIWPSLAAIGAFGITSVGVLRQSERERKQVREAFSRYVSPAIVEALARDPSRLVLGGETRTLTVLFSDVRGFTARSESLPAEEVVRFLNEVHTPMTEHVLATGGTLDKFIGDGMMAFWNAPLDHPDPVRAALRCALRMRETVLDLDRRSREEAEAAGRIHVPLAIGVGIHVGPACVGNIGSVRRFDYSAIGDTVNAAARIEPLCKNLCISVLASEEVMQAAPDFGFLFAGSVTLRGRQGATRLYALYGDERAVDADFLRYRQMHDRAVLLAEAGSSAAAEELRRCAESPLSGRFREFYALLLERHGGQRLAAE